MITPFSTKSKLFSYDHPSELKCLEKASQLIRSKLSQKEPVFVVTTNIEAMTQLEQELKGFDITTIKSSDVLTGKEKLMQVGKKKLTTQERLLAALQQDKPILCTQATFQAIKKKNNLLIQKLPNYSLIFLGDPKLYEYYSYNIKDLSVLLWSNSFALANEETAIEQEKNKVPFREKRKDFQLHFRRVYEVYRGNKNDQFNKNIKKNEVFNSLLQDNYSHDLYLEPGSVAPLARYKSQNTLSEEEEEKELNKRYTIFKILSPLISNLFKEIYSFTFNYQISQVHKYYSFFGFDFFYIDISDEGKVSLRDTPLMSEDGIREILSQRVIMGHNQKGKISSSFNIFSFARRNVEYFSPKNTNRYFDPLKTKSVFSYSFWNTVDYLDIDRATLLRKYQEEILPAWQKSTRIAKSDKLAYVAVKQAGSSIYLEDNKRSFIQKYPSSSTYKLNEVKGLIYAHCSNPSPNDHKFFGFSHTSESLGLSNLLVNIFKCEPVHKNSGNLHLYVASPFVANALRVFCESGSQLYTEEKTTHEKIIQVENFESYGKRVHNLKILREKMTKEEYWELRGKIKEIMISKKNNNLTSFSHRSLLVYNIKDFFTTWSRTETSSEVPSPITYNNFSVSYTFNLPWNKATLNSYNIGFHYSFSFPRASFMARLGKVREEGKDVAYALHVFCEPVSQLYTEGKTTHEKIKEIMISKKNNNLTSFSHRSLLVYNIKDFFTTWSRTETSSEVPSPITYNNFSVSYTFNLPWNKATLNSYNIGFHYSFSFPRASFMARLGKVRGDGREIPRETLDATEPKVPCQEGHKGLSGCVSRHPKYAELFEAAERIRKSDPFWREREFLKAQERLRSEKSSAWEQFHEEQLQKRVERYKNPPKVLDRFSQAFERKRQMMSERSLEEIIHGKEADIDMDAVEEEFKDFDYDSI